MTLSLPLPALHWFEFGPAPHPAFLASIYEESFILYNNLRLQW